MLPKFCFVFYTLKKNESNENTKQKLRFNYTIVKYFCNYYKILFQ